MKLYKSIIISIVIIVLSSCGPATSIAKQSSVPMPDIGAEIQQGKYLEVMAPDGWNTFKTNKIISLAIRNVSESPISSGPDFGARIFIRTDEKWLEVQNKIIYENDPFTLEPSDNWNTETTASIGVRPVLSDYSVPYDIRIFVIGDLVESGQESKKVASYIDLRLNP